MSELKAAATGSLVDKNRKEFSVDFKKFYILCVPCIVIAAGLVFFGVRYYNLSRQIEEMARQAGGTVPDSFPPDWSFYVLPWSFAALIVVSLVYVLMFQGRRHIVVTPAYIEIHDGKDVVKTLWQNLSFTPPPVDKKRFRTAILSDGRYYARIDEFFYPQFDLLLEVIVRAKKYARENMST